MPLNYYDRTIFLTVRGLAEIKGRDLERKDYWTRPFLEIMRLKTNNDRQIKFSVYIGDPCFIIGENGLAESLRFLEINGAKLKRPDSSFSFADITLRPWGRFYYLLTRHLALERSSSHKRL